MLCLFEHSSGKVSALSVGEHVRIPLVPNFPSAEIEFDGFPGFASSIESAWSTAGGRERLRAVRAPAGWS